MSLYTSHYIYSSGEYPVTSISPLALFKGMSACLAR